MLATVVVVALKVVLVAAAGTVTEGPTDRVELVLVSVTVVPPAGAAWVRVTVQVLEAPEPRLVGLQATEESTVGATRLRVAVWEAPLREAVTTAD